MSKGEFDVALGARVISKEAGGRIQVLFFSDGWCHVMKIALVVINVIDSIIIIFSAKSR